MRPRSGARKATVAKQHAPGAGARFKLNKHSNFSTDVGASVSDLPREFDGTRICAISSQSQQGGRLAAAKVDI
jgi:hypothetical protein